MDKKKLLLIGGGVAAGSILLYLLLKKRNSDDGQRKKDPVIESADTQATQTPENPFSVLVRELTGIWGKKPADNLQTYEGEAVTDATYLQRGSKGSKVIALQKFLNQSSGAGLVVDGDYGKLTQDAVKAEQDPFSTFQLMYPNSVYGAVSKTYYDLFVKSFE